MQVQFELTHMEHRALRSFMDHAQIVNTSFAVRIALCDWLIRTGYLRLPAPKPRRRRWDRRHKTAVT